MSRRSNKQVISMRARIAAAAARIMAEDGVDDFGLAKRKAARSLGAAETEALPGNDEIEAELRAYRDLYQPEEHAERITELRALALQAMTALEQFHPYLTGPVLRGIAGPYAEIDLQLFPERSKELELFLLERNIPFSTHEARRYSGDRVHPVSVFSMLWQDTLLKLSVFDPRDERISLRTTQAGRPQDRAGLSEVAALLQRSSS
jgi:hypothetical protein